jgi:hypothetical protein|tara:strand:+ start:802 stop:1299 length:498 start_codon:yes stop_codon:yes gene_type:complete
VAKAKPIDSMFDKLTTTQKMIKLGEEMIGMMIERTQRGFGVEGVFKSYSSKGFKPYWKRKREGGFKRQSAKHKPNSARDVNLTLTSDMLNSFKVKLGRTNEDQVTIGMPPQHAIKANAQELQGRAISTTAKPVTEMEEKFIAEFFDREIKKAMKDASGRTEIVIG